MAQMKRRTWKDMRTREKTGLVFFWVLIIVAGYWLFVAGPSHKPTSGASEIEPVAAAATFTSASEQALKSATQYIADLDKAMTDGSDILKHGRLQELGAQSRSFNALADAGQTKFGKSVFEPLGQCFSAGIFARSWWQSQVSAASNGGIETIHGSIKDALSSYHSARDLCLKSADPVAVAKADADQDAELRKKFGGGKECLKVYTVDADTKELSEKTRPAHCKN